MFGTDPKVGLSTSVLSTETIAEIETEEDLERVLGNTRDDDVDVDCRADDLGITCIVCETACDAAQICRICHLPCHINCGINTDGATDDGAELTCSLCFHGESATDHRRGAKRAMEEQAEKMKQASDKRFKPGDVGSSVRVPIPEVDRGRTDHRNLIGVVMEITDGLYKIGTKHGSLKSLYSRGQFELCAENFLNMVEVPDVEISLREAATSASVGTGQGFSKCACAGTCDTRRCKCYAGKMLCNSKCHGGRMCKNKG